jgi:cytochrome c oxidase subunit 2
MNKGLLIGLVVIAILVIVAATGGLFKQKETEAAITQPTETTEPEFSEATAEETAVEQLEQIEEPEAVEETTQQVKEFNLIARKWSFEPSVISVKQGDRVKLIITSVDVTHGLALPEFNINTVLAPNTAVEVEFVADKKGTFTFFCSVPCGAGHSNMNGRLIVE